MLALIGEDPIRANLVREVVDVDRAAVSRAVSALVARGLVHRRGGRNARLSVTAEGARLRTAVRDLALERERRLFAGVSPEEQALLLAYLQRLAPNLPSLAALDADIPQAPPERLSAHDGQ